MLAVLLLIRQSPAQWLAWSDAMRAVWLLLVCAGGFSTYVGALLVLIGMIILIWPDFVFAQWTWPN